MVLGQERERHCSLRNPSALSWGGVPRHRARNGISQGFIKGKLPEARGADPGVFLQAGGGASMKRGRERS